MTTIIRRGMKVKCLAASGYHDLTEGKVYVALHDQEQGVFAGMPYVRVIGDLGEEVMAYARRFKLASEDKQ